MEYRMPTITTKRLCVRPLEMEDVYDLQKIYQDDRVMMGNAGVKPIKSIDGMMRFLKYGFLSYHEWNIPQAMVLERLEDGVVIGIINFHTIRGDVGELGYLLAQDVWKQGYMSEALEVMLHLGFTHLHFHRIEAYFDPSNHGSERLLKKHGFVKEGMLRKAMMLNDDVYHDLILCSILQEEFDINKYVFESIEEIKNDKEENYEEGISAKV